LDEVRRAIAILSGERANTASSIEANERVPVLDASATYVREHV
jgi:hypothetical protein